MKIKLNSITFIFSLSVVSILAYSDYQKDVEEISLIKKRGKISSCMSILRNSLSEGNKEFKEKLSNSKFDKTKSYEKLVMNTISNCYDKISENEVEQILSPENIIHLNNQFVNLLTFDKNILTGNELALTEQESYLLNEISDASQTLDTDLSMQEDEIGIAGIKISQFGNYQYIFVIIAICLFFFIVIGGLYTLIKKKPIKKEKKNKKKN